MCDFAQKLLWPLHFLHTLLGWRFNFKCIKLPFLPISLNQYLQFSEGNKKTTQNMILAQTFILHN